MFSMVVLLSNVARLGTGSWQSQAVTGCYCTCPFLMIDAGNLELSMLFAEVDLTCDQSSWLLAFDVCFFFCLAIACSN